MMASDARELARAWVERELPAALDPAGLRGAYIMGSLAAMADDDLFDETARDVDIAVVVRPHIVPLNREHYPHGKFLLFEGLIIQLVLLPDDVFETDETLLGMLGLGCNLGRGAVLADPEGLLADAKVRIDRNWGAEQWLSQRTSRAVSFAEEAVEALAEAQAPPGRLASLVEAVTQIAGLVPISRGLPPTHRGALAHLHVHLEADARLDLHDGLLAAIGAQNAGEDELRRAIGDAMTAARIELSYPSGPDLSPSFRERMPAFIEAGILELAHRGWVREAMLPAVGSLAMSSLIVGDRASSADRRRLDDLAVGRLAQLGVHDETGWCRHARYVRDLLGEVTSYLTT